MIIHYAHGGGYTELGGTHEFLKKIRGDLEFKRIFPAIKKPPKKEKVRINPEDEGVTGKNLFRRLKERIDVWREEIKVIVIIDDGDCKFYNQEKNFIVSLEEFKKYIDEKNIKGIFLFFEPEIEKIFCIDKSWHKNIPCENIDLHRKLDELLCNINYNLNEEKTSCKEKFSDKFKATLKLCGINYSKKNNGAEYLKRISPEKVSEKDKLVGSFVLEMKQL